MGRLSVLCTLSMCSHTRFKVAAIPVSAFYQHGNESGIVRFCFAKQDATLALALARLATI